MKRVKCKYCGRLIYWERDRHGTPRAVDSYIYYKEDPAGNLLVLTSLGDIVRATKDDGRDANVQVGAVLHASRCAPVPMYIRGGSSYRVSGKTPGRSILDDTAPVPDTDTETETVTEVRQVSLFDTV